MRIVFAGTPAFAATILDALIRSGSPPFLVLTQPDRPGKRGRGVLPPPVKVLAQAQGIEVYQPPTLSPRRDEGQQALARIMGTAFDVLVVAAYGLMIPRPLLAHPAHGAVNVHASLLPRWRGAAPVERAIMAGDQRTGVSLMQMDAGLDTGPVLSTASMPIAANATGTEVTERLATIGAELLCAGLPRLGELRAEPQDDAIATHAPKLTAADAVVHWSCGAQSLHDQVRALSGRQTATAHLAAGSERVTVRLLATSVIDTLPSDAPPGTIMDTTTREQIVVATGAGTLAILRLQLSLGKGTALTAREACNGWPALFQPGNRFDTA
ncbi:MAG: methionyl-tRNA formyltransferase [Pseudomonadales bacterium]